MNPKVDNYLIQGCMRCPKGDTPECKVHRWQEELKLLRSIVLDAGLTEEFKWSQPCYSINGSNVLLVTAFKEFATVAFFKGALINDEGNLLVKAGDNSQAGRQMRFSSVAQIIEQEAILKDYIGQAVEAEKSGKKVERRNPEDLEIPEELENKFNEMPELSKAFYSLTPGRQRAYVLYITQAKQSKTRESRIEKYIPQILAGKGLMD